MTMKENLQKNIEDLQKGAAYQNYLWARERVMTMLDAAASEGAPSDYWRDELAGFNYMFDASPLIVNTLREHCYHITGLQSYTYRAERGSHKGRSDKMATKLQMLRSLDQGELFVHESPALAGFGYAIDGGLVNIDTLKFYESLIAMERGGALDPFRKAEGGRKTIMEIGSGWGGFAYQFKTLFPNSCYLLVDLPQTMIFSATYLKTLFPNASMVMYDERSDMDIQAEMGKHDFIFIPAETYSSLGLTGVDLAINMISFQEMTTGQVSGYVKTLADTGCPCLYSHNRNLSPYNNELTAVSEIIATRYQTEEIALLGVDYMNMNAPTEQPTPGPLGRLRLAMGGACKGRGDKDHPFRYRHMIGRLVA